MCIGNMVQTDVLKPIQTTMKENRELIVLGCETIARLFLANKEPLVKQVSRQNIVDYKK